MKCPLNGKKNIFCKASVVFLILSLIITSILAHAEDTRQENNIISTKKSILEEKEYNVAENIQIQQREIIVNLKKLEKNL